ncbi:MFS transporter [Halalkalibacter sp. AB-rgal2]|uniref:MFS transporter n=1 Tax=Halalkalibacter sp. AB-rgal2 TaxID=3242695 RepID=UPI00359EC401
MNQFTKLFGDRKWVIYHIALLVGFAMGTIVPIATTYMTQLQTSSVWIGVISSSFFLTMALGSIYLVRTINGKDVSIIIILGLVTTAICSMIFPFVQSTITWLVLMSLMGMGISFNLVGVQTAMHSLTQSDSKALVSGVYSLFFACGFVISAISGPIIYDWNNWMPFFIASFALFVTSWFIYLKLKGAIIVPHNQKRNVFTRVKLPLYGAFVYGFIETTVIALYPMYLLMRGIEITMIGFAFGIFVFGGVIGTIPVTYLADRIGREKCYGLTVAISVLSIIGIMTFTSFTGILIFSFITGFAVGPLYALSLALTVQDLKNDELSSGTALFTFTYGIGSAAGPILSAIAIQLFGVNHLFTISLLFFLLLFIQLTLTQLTIKKKTEQITG